MESLNSYGVPKAEFIEDIKAAAPTPEAAEKLYREKTELMSKYRMLETHFLEKQQNFKRSRPSVAENLNAIKKLEAMADKGDVKTNFQLADSLYSTATINSESTVCLWLGANIMVEYPFSEAKTLLTENLAALDKQIDDISKNLIFLRDQIITTEVTLSRIVNHLIQLNKKK
ncbi:Prefoldin subunit family protein [Trichomonas vaginalis G3]|uniref:Prefoldin subunit 3 n=1 Tax=Trichomonas vaginalis (strain ATCC PRA-98 / G3) TaxID=412133 RepID=A2EHV1_TRIV3|nr:tubulin complex assembly [Trichomonas vaginalis G3]EAY07791.1 Prefoldin subunit family protein [Trichomonas vaginalis G3]KAI5542934.1 tubulin complex assembly [Trichomonas vaginalis G3]|eukprot:XP_001320014.1 Prefoldin subunit family protein [Trichomonas vaginalis G3]